MPFAFRYIFQYFEVSAMISSFAFMEEFQRVKARFDTDRTTPVKVLVEDLVMKWLFPAPFKKVILVFLWRQLFRPNENIMRIGLVNLLSSQNILFEVCSWESHPIEAASVEFVNGKVPSKKASQTFVLNSHLGEEAVVI